MIKYVIQAKKNPLKKNEVKYYPQMAPTTPMTLAQIVKRVEKRLRGIKRNVTKWKMTENDYIC